MSEWDGFASLSYGGAGGGDRLTVSADYGGPDDDPTPLASLRQVLRDGDGHLRLSDSIELAEPELRWLVEEAAPRVLARMGERP